MSIRQARTAQMLEDLAKAALLEGRMPTSAELTKRMGDWTAANQPGEPRMQLRLQGYRTKFRRDLFNQTVDEFLEDLDLLFDENVAVATRLLMGINADDVRCKSLRYQLSLLDDKLEDLLLAEPATTGYFFGVYDSFVDFSKVDQADTTAEVDIETGTVRLPQAGGVDKVNLGFMMNRVLAPMKFYPPEPIINSRAIPGARFGSLFDDLIGTAWGAQVVSSQNVPITLEFTFPLSSADPDTKTLNFEPATVASGAVSISRVDVDPLGPTAMGLVILYSMDQQNWLKLPDHPSQLNIDGKKISLRFEAVLAKYLRFQLTKASDETIPDPKQPAYNYTYGLRGISVYTMGYASLGELKSKELAPDGIDAPVVNKVALTVDEKVPDGTDIDYYVSRADGPEDWIKISSGRHDDCPRIVEFGTTPMSPRLDNKILIKATPTLHSTRNGIKFYQLYQSAFDPVAKTGRLLRGLNAWSRKANTVEDTKSVSNNFVVFTMSDNEQKLYLDVVDERIDAPGPSSGTEPTWVSVKNTILVDPSINLIPTGPSPAESPNYSIKSVIRLTSGGEGGSTATVTVMSPGVVRVELPSSVAGKILVGHYIYLAPPAAPGHVATGYYKVSTVYDGSTVILTIEDPGRALRDGTNVPWSLAYQDITAKVTEAEQNRIELASDQPILLTDQLIVTYRTPLNSNQRLVTSSVVVKRDTSGNEVFVAGLDYTVDAETKSITRMTGGHITGVVDQMTVRVDFQYVETSADLDTYSAWFFVDAAEPKTIELGAAIGLAVGERAFIDNGISLVDFTELTVLPPLPRGWRQVIVRSAPIYDSAGSVDTSSGIYKILTLLDSAGNFVFAPNAKYFVKMTAFPEAMRETNLFRLQTGITPDDRGWFAFDGRKVIVNWDPTTLPDTIRPVASAGPTLSLLAYEEFELEYRYVGSASAPSSVLFKAVLQRESAAPTVTPELFSYNLRFSF